MINLFVSYRRQDAAPYAGRICDRLGAAFGSDHVFMDVEDIPPGVDFAEAIENKVGACNVLVAVIGPQWLELLRTRSGENDFVEHEIAGALRRRVIVIPVLVGGAALPAERDLPPPLAGLVRRQAITIRDDRFDQDASDLVHGIRRAAGADRSSKRLLAAIVAAGIVIALLGTALFFWSARDRASLDGAWIARMQRPGQRPYNIRLHFQTSGHTLTGQVDYPTGSGAIEGGTVNRGQIAFFTRHTPQFADGPVTILVSGQRRGREIEITFTAPDATVTKGIARKVGD